LFFLSASGDKGIVACKCLRGLVSVRSTAATASAAVEAPLTAYTAVLLPLASTSTAVVGDAAVEDEEADAEAGEQKRLRKRVGGWAETECSRRSCNRLRLRREVGVGGVGSKLSGRPLFGGGVASRRRGGVPSRRGGVVCRTVSGAAPGAASLGVFGATSLGVLGAASGAGSGAVAIMAIVATIMAVAIMAIVALIVAALAAHEPRRSP